MPLAVKPPALCIFDLDGTLIDSLRDIAEALNECLELLGLAPHPVQRYRYMVGEGVPKLCERALGYSHPHLVNRLAELARPRYRVRPLRYTRPYPGVVESLEQLRRSGVKLAVLSNKPHDVTVSVVRAFWPADTFECIQGYVEERHRKPDPHYVFRICQNLGVSLSRTCVIGDTPTDVETAQRSGAASVGVTWGFRSRADLAHAGAEYLVDFPLQLATALGCGG
ncbi:MAG: HAD family hydrolase [Phycisphaerae bacterium]